MKDKKRTILLVSIGIIAFITIIGGATFAFFASTQDINANLPANITTAAKTYTFIASSEGDINFHLSAQDMSEANVNANYVTVDNGLINVEVASANDDEITRCTYDIAWVWDSSDKYTESDVTLPHTSGDKTYPYELSLSVNGESEQDLSSYTLDSNNSFIIATGLTSIATNTTSVIDSHKIEVKAYNIPVDQQKLFNKSFKAHAEVRNVNCDVMKGTIAKLNNGTFYNALLADVNGTTDFIDTDSTVYSGAIINENGLRYEGKNPNNYVLFNDELWRIIGVFDEETHGRSEEQLVKLIRAEALLGYYQWDITPPYGNNNWNNAVLKTMLNTNYYNNETINACSNYNENSCIATTVTNEGIKTKIARNMIQPIKWKLGAVTYKKTVSETYIAERSETLPSSSGATAVSIEELPVGLVYPSDYGYATLESDCARTMQLGNYNGGMLCYQNSWLYDASTNKWTLSPSTSQPWHVYDVDISSGSNGYDANYILSVFPVLYLKQNVAITGGLGTKTNPYLIKN